MQKYGFDEARPILERASARETAARVALGAVARSYLKETAGIEIVSHVVELAAAKAPYGVYPTPSDVERLDADPVRCLDADASEAMVAEIDQAHKDGDTLGGVVEVLAYGVPVGLGSHVHWDRRLDARLAAALMGIQAIKGVEVGDGFGLARVPGSQAHDEILATDEGIKRASGRSGGTEGGLTTGELLRVRAAMKPIATVPRALATVDVATGEAAQAHHQRSDVCAVPAAGIVAEAMVALVLADAVAEKFGGDSVARDPPQRPRRTSTTSRSDERADVWPDSDGWADAVNGPVVVLIGPMGVGKTTVGELLAERLGTGFRDSDADIVAAQARPVADIFVDEGEPYFRELEREAPYGWRSPSTRRPGARRGRRPRRSPPASCSAGCPWSS